MFSTLVVMRPVRVPINPNPPNGGTWTSDFPTLRPFKIVPGAGNRLGSLTWLSFDTFLTFSPRSTSWVMMWSVTVRSSR
jgi:hypothetical protein